MDRGIIYPTDSQYTFIGAPADYIPTMKFLRQDPKNRDFVERQEREFPIILSQKYGYLPEWYRDFKKKNQDF